MRPKRLFISYCHDDEVWCSEFVDALKARGVEVWFDRHELTPEVTGADLQSALLTALDICDLIVMVYSPTSRNSSWVAWEILQNQQHKRLVVLHNAPVGMVGAFVRYLANCGVYDVGSLSGAYAAGALIPSLEALTQIPDDILQGLLKSESKADALWQLYGYKPLIK